MRKINIIKEVIGNNKVVVYPSSYINPMSDLVFFEQELVAAKCEPGNVLIDLLLCNGDNFNRFSSFYFDGKRIIRNTIDLVFLSEKDEERVNAFYSNNKSILKNSVLVKSEYMTYAKKY